jgi:ketosteroid isomerase-like protein
MSNPELERILREGVEAYNRGDTESLAVFMHPEIESHVGPGQGQPGTWHGPDGFREMTEAWSESFVDQKTRIVGTEMPDEHHLIAEVHQTAFGALSRVPVEMTNYYLVDFRDGKVVRFHIYSDRQAALDAIRSG